MLIMYSFLLVDSAHKNFFPEFKSSKHHCLRKVPSTIFSQIWLRSLFGIADNLELDLWSFELNPD
jgi:hypothetical protein